MVIAARLGSTVRSVVFDAGEHRFCSFIAFALKAVHPGFGNGGTKVGIFAGAFAYPPPARVAANIHHRRESPVQSGNCCFQSGNPGALFNGGHIPTGGFAKRDWKDGFVAVNDIVAKEHWNAEARFFHSDALQIAGESSRMRIKNSAYPPLFDVVFVAGPKRWPRHIPVGGEEGHLAHFFFHRHQGKQGIYFAFDALV